MSDENKMVRWHNNGRGPRVLVTLGGEDVMIDVVRARNLYVALGQVLYQIEASGGRTDPRGDHRE